MDKTALLKYFPKIEKETALIDALIIDLASKNANYIERSFGPWTYILSTKSPFSLLESYKTESNFTFYRYENISLLHFGTTLPFQAEVTNHSIYEAHKDKEGNIRIHAGWQQTSALLGQTLAVIAKYKLELSSLETVLVGQTRHMVFHLTKATNLDLLSFTKELSEAPLFSALENIEKLQLPGRSGYFLGAAIHFCHQMLLQLDPSLYRLPKIEETFVRFPTFGTQLFNLFEAKFHKEDNASFNTLKNSYLSEIEKLDTGSIFNDNRRKKVLSTALSFVENTLKTNFYCDNLAAYSFRLKGEVIKELPKDKFPELPFAIFYMFNASFQGFHIRFKDLARGGLRTVIPRGVDKFSDERQALFPECYNLAFTQQKKNKDIPEGGSKGVILLCPGIDAPSAQKAYIESFLTLINGDKQGRLKASNIIDHYKKPEWIYLGPDENLSNEIIEWIAFYSKSEGYALGSSFISSKPKAGINHKEYGVTSLCVNVYMEHLLRFAGIDPTKQSFTVKITGGPDGDVAGNQLKNLLKHFPKTAKLIALRDGSGTIYDPEGIDLEQIAKQFKETVAINGYPTDLLHKEGFLLNRNKKNEKGFYFLFKEGKETWVDADTMNHLFGHHIHEIKADIFIAAGGRPRTLNKETWKEFLIDGKEPSSKLIVEGANLYATNEARQELEKLDVLIIKDSSANKGGVICSSFEVLASLILSEEEFLKEKAEYVKEVQEAIVHLASSEADLLLRERQAGSLGGSLIAISDAISACINDHMYALLDYLAPKEINADLNEILIGYCPKLLREKYKERIAKNIPDLHKKAIIACRIASQIIYKNGIKTKMSPEDMIKEAIKMWC